jgi:oligoendopeptidase F
MEIPLEDVETLFKTYLASPEVAKVGEVIKKRLGRDLEPFDIWYDGFKTRTSIPAETLDKTTRAKYPDPEAVQADLPAILVKLGFTRERAEEICSKVQVDPARGSGHAWGAESRDQKSRLRTRIFSNGMDYKGYNIAVHEFGHNVEQTITLQDVDYYMLKGVPNTAFTEALAFMFQKNDLQLLGLKNTNQLQEYDNNLDNFWALYEIMGVSLVDIGTWKWLYDHPGATSVELKDAVNSIAKEIWNQYYAPVFGIRDQPILAIYSHMINSPLYLPYYAYGHIIEFQLAEYLEGKPFAPELERILRQGRLTPQQWMQGAVGSPISVQPILNAANEALGRLVTSSK